MYACMKAHSRLHRLDQGARVCDAPRACATNAHSPAARLRDTCARPLACERAYPTEASRKLRARLTKRRRRRGVRADVHLALVQRPRPTHVRDIQDVEVANAFPPNHHPNNAEITSKRISL